MAHWVSAWGQAHTDILGMQPAWKGRTCMLSFCSAIAGEAVRLRLSNQEGRRPLVIGRAAVSAGGVARIRYIRYQRYVSPSSLRYVK